jgi:hypothetical protein
MTLISSLYRASIYYTLTARSWCATGEKRGAVLQKNKKNGALELI